MNSKTLGRSPCRFSAPRWLVVLVSSLVGLLLALGLVAGLDGLTRRPIAWAASLTVTTTADELNGDGDCSLREAIQAANTDTTVDACPAGSGADTITLPAGTYTLTLAGAGEDGNAAGDLDITGPLTLDGADMATTIINANALDRALHVPTAGVTLNLLNLTVRNGRVPGFFDSGGGLYAAGPVVVSNTTFRNNTANDGGGAYFASAATVTGTTFLSNTATFINSGGGAFFGGAATVTGTTFLGNTAYFGGGAYFDGAATVTDTTFLGNTAFSGGGGALFDGAATVMGTTFNGNTATIGHGGGTYFNSAATVMGTTFNRNTAGTNGGGAYFYGLRGAATGDFVNTLFAANHADSNRGAGLYAVNYGGDDVVTLRHITIASPTVGSGSAVYVVSGTVNLTNTIVASYSVGLERAGGVLNENYTLFSGVATPYSGAVVSGGNSMTGTAAFADVTLYKLTSASAAIDAGTDVGVTSDFEGDPRPGGAGFDIGWDEFMIPIYLPLITRNASPSTLAPQGGSATPRAGRPVPPPVAPAGLTRREGGVLRLVAQSLFRNSAVNE